MQRRQDRVKIPVMIVVERYLAGESENSIAKAYLTSRNVIRRHLEIIGIHIRTQSEAESLKWTFMSPEARVHQVEAAHKASLKSKRPRNKIWRINPTESELYFDNLVLKYNWPLTYCGCGGIVINGCNPDFIHKTQRKVVEVYTGDKHLEKGKKYTEAGYECLFVSTRQSEGSIFDKVQQFL